MNSPGKSPSRAILTFDAVDDLVGAHARGRLMSTPQVRYAATDICPLIELIFEATNGRTGPLLRTARLDEMTQKDLRDALAGSQDIWLDRRQSRGFMRTTFNPLVEADDLQRNRFLMAARSAAEAALHVKPLPSALLPRCAN